MTGPAGPRLQPGALTMAPGRAETGDTMTTFRILSSRGDRDKRDHLPSRSAYHVRADGPAAIEAVVARIERDTRTRKCGGPRLDYTDRDGPVYQISFGVPVDGGFIPSFQCDVRLETAAAEREAAVRNLEAVLSAYNAYGEDNTGPEATAAWAEVREAARAVAKVDAPAASKALAAHGWSLDILLLGE